MIKIVFKIVAKVEVAVTAVVNIIVLIAGVMILHILVSLNNSLQILIADHTARK